MDARPSQCDAIVGGGVHLQLPSGNAGIGKRPHWNERLRPSWKIGESLLPITIRSVCPLMIIGLQCHAGNNVFRTGFDKDWFKYIPFCSDLTALEHFQILRHGHPGVLSESIEFCAAIKALLSEAIRLSEGRYGEVR